MCDWPNCVNLFDGAILFHFFPALRENERNTKRFRFRRPVNANHAIKVNIFSCVNCCVMLFAIWHKFHLRLLLCFNDANRFQLYNFCLFAFFIKSYHLIQSTPSISSMCVWCLFRIEYKTHSLQTHKAHSTHELLFSLWVV